MSEDVTKRKFSDEEIDNIYLSDGNICIELIYGVNNAYFTRQDVEAMAQHFGLIEGET